MFGNLRAGSLIYILSKNDTPALSIGQVSSVSAPRPKNPASFMPSPMPMEQVIDISVKTGDDTKNFTGVSTTLSVVDTGTAGYIISDDRAAITAEIEALGTLSHNVLASVPYHQRVEAACKDMLLQLNPSLQKEAERDNEMNNLRGQITEMRATMNEMASLLKGVLNNGNAKTKKE